LGDSRSVDDRAKLPKTIHLVKARSLRSRHLTRRAVRVGLSPSGRGDKHVGLGDSRSVDHRRETAQDHSLGQGTLAALAPLTRRARQASRPQRFPVSSTTGAKLPKIMRLPSNGISPAASMRGSFMNFSMPASRVALSGHSTQENTTDSPSFACTERRKSVTLPSG